MSENTYSELHKVLSTNSKFLEEDLLKKNLVIESTLKNDEELLNLLLSNELLKKQFFTSVKGVLIFDHRKFLTFVSNKSFLPDSYTAFKNRIGLSVSDLFIKSSKDVVLVWPYKDCILQGGQTKEEEKTNEVFWNQVLAPDEIDRLLKPKVFTDFKIHSSDGIDTPESLNESDNYVFEGNNLLVLHSLTRVFKDSVKLIYIDPPYNTGNDSFKYNDSFNHSSWLTFMKNRLEVSLELLADEGSIWINIDDNELSYLSVLMDEIFGKENHIATVSIKRSAPTGHKAINPAPINVTDYLIGYAKNKPLWNYKITHTKRGYDTAYDRFIENYQNGFENWKFTTVKQALKRLDLNSVEDLIVKHPERVIRFAEPNYQGVGKETRELIDKSKENESKVLKQERENHPDIYLKAGQRILFYKDKLKDIDGEMVTAEPLTNFWADIPFQGIAKEGGVTLHKGKKPEYLLKRIIEFSTNKKDIVLDYFMGSGTTMAVCHKLDRQYIGIEQLDYGENSATNRLTRCIQGDKTGISKLAHFKGGGSFITMCLKENNAVFETQIQQSKNSKDLRNILNQMIESGNIRYEVIADNFDPIEFEALDLIDQKQILLDCLDLNQLYLNYSEIEDEQYNVSAEDKTLNDLFYSLSF